MIVKLTSLIVAYTLLFESSVNSYDSQTEAEKTKDLVMFESSVNSYDSQTYLQARF